MPRVIHASSALTAKLHELRRHSTNIRDPWKRHGPALVTKQRPVQFLKEDENHVFIIEAHALPQG